MSDAQAKKPTRRRRDKVFRVKVITLGDAGTGKSTLIKRICEEKFYSKYLGTIGVDFGVKSVVFGEFDVRINFFDMAGADCYFEVRNEFYEDTQAAIFVYDTTDRKSFLSLDRWVAESTRHGMRAAVSVVVATKSDALERQVHEDEGRKWARKQRFPFFEVSSQSGAGVQALFATVMGNLLKRLNGIPDELTMLAVRAAHEARKAHNVDDKFCV